jgi:hypothetical protein
MEWPGYDKDELFGFHKVINEPDFYPLHFVRILTQAAKLFRSHRGKLVPTPLGRKILSGEQHGPLQALLFHVAFWRLNLGYFDRYAVDTWPQNEIGVVLWSLSASAHDWLPREALTRLCTSPVVGILESEWDFGSDWVIPIFEDYEMESLDLESKFSPLRDNSHFDSHFDSTTERDEFSVQIIERSKHYPAKIDREISRLAEPYWPAKNSATGGEDSATDWIRSIFSV